jgi:hypothetical protein
MRALEPSLQPLELSFPRLRALALRVRLSLGALSPLALCGCLTSVRFSVGDRDIRPCDKVGEMRAKYRDLMRSGSKPRVGGPVGP